MLWRNKVTGDSPVWKEDVKMIYSIVDLAVISPVCYLQKTTMAMCDLIVIPIGVLYITKK